MIHAVENLIALTACHLDSLVWDNRERHDQLIVVVGKDEVHHTTPWAAMIFRTM